MSGALLRGVGISGAVQSILFGDAGPVVLGSVTFDGLEVPASIAWGGNQAMTVHKLPGGRRVIDAMGRDDAPISWSGVMIGSNRMARAYALDQMRIAGWAVELTWNEHVYTVLVKEFACTDAAFRCEYRISCEVLRDESADPNSTRPSLIGQVLNAINFGLAIYSKVNAAIGLGDAIMTDLSAAQDSATATTAVTAGADAAVAMTADVQAAQDEAGASLAAGDMAIANLGTVTLLGTTDPDAGLANLLTASDQSGAQAGASFVVGVTGQAIANLSATPGEQDATAFLDPGDVGQATGDQIGTRAQTAGGDLYTIAAAQFGDATQWYRILEASGLGDPMLTGLVTLTIPQPIPAPSPGLPEGQDIA